MKTCIVALLGFIVCSYGEKNNYRQVIETKYGAEIKNFKVISFSKTTKVLWFDWQEKWWGSFNVIEIGNTGKPIYWYDIREYPTAQSIEQLRVVTVSGKKYLEIIDCTHMGNGMFYLYSVDRGVVQLLMKARVIANLSVKFQPRLASITYADEDHDGDEDVSISATWINENADKKKQTGSYKRVFLNQKGAFVEDFKKRIGRPELFE